MIPAPSTLVMLDWMGLGTACGLTPVIGLERVRLDGPDPRAAVHPS